MLTLSTVEMSAVDTPQVPSTITAYCCCSWCTAVSLARTSLQIPSAEINFIESIAPSFSRFTFVLRLTKTDVVYFKAMIQFHNAPRGPEMPQRTRKAIPDYHLAAPRTKSNLLSLRIWIPAGAAQLPLFRLALPIFIFANVCQALDKTPTTRGLSHCSISTFPTPPLPSISTRSSIRVSMIYGRGPSAVNISSTLCSLCAMLCILCSI